MGPPQRVRYNTKARGGKSHKKRHLHKKVKGANSHSAAVEGKQVGLENRVDDDAGSSPENADDTVLDANDNETTSILPIEIIVPKTTAEKERDRKERMMQEVSSSRAC